MSFAVVINDSSGKRVLGEQDLPLNIGTAADAAIRIPGPVAEGHLAHIGMLDGEKTIDEIWESVCLRLGDDMPNQDEIILLLSKLFQANVLFSVIRLTQNHILRAM